jgi:hypothetical protein
LDLPKNEPESSKIVGIKNEKGKIEEKIEGLLSSEGRQIKTPAARAYIFAKLSPSPRPELALILINRATRLPAARPPAWPPARPPVRPE